MVPHLDADVDSTPRAQAGRPRAAIVMGDAAFGELFDDVLLARLESLVELASPMRLTELNSAAAASRLADVELLLTGWGTPPITQAVLDAAPRLRAIFHAGGTVKNHITSAVWDRDLVVTSASDANAIPVAEFTLGTILLEGKRARDYATKLRAHRDGDDAWRRSMPEAINYRGIVGIVGLSRVGRRVATLLRPFDLEVIAYDPYATTRDAIALGVRLLPLDDVFATSDIVSLHAPGVAATHHLANRHRLSLMKDHGVLINTARGSIVDTEALIDECRSGRLRAVLDVTDPEPLPADSPLYDLPTVELTPHIAGSMHRETHRMTSSALDEIARYLDGSPLQHRVDGRSMETIA